MRRQGERDYRRSDRVASEIREVMAMILSRFSKDSALSRTTITRVSVSSDLRNATLYFTVFPGEDPLIYQESFDRNRGGLRRELSSRIRMKYIPDLRFTHDSLGSEADRIERILLEGVKEED